MKKPIVWIIKEQSQRNAIGSNAMDYSPAEVHGDIEFVTKSDIPLYARSSIKLQWDLDVEKFATEFDPEKDFIIATGQPTAIFHVGHQLGLLGKQPRYLVWRRDENTYRVLEITKE